MNYYIPCQLERCIFCEREVCRSVISEGHMCEGKCIMTVGVCDQSIERENISRLYLPFSFSYVLMCMSLSFSVRRSSVSVYNCQCQGQRSIRVDTALNTFPQLLY